MRLCHYLVFSSALVLQGLVPALSAPAETIEPVEGFHFIDTDFENASPLDWQIDEDRMIRIQLLRDHERSSPNCAGGHWHFRLEAEPGSAWTIVLSGFDNIWNGKPGSPVSDQTTCWTSPDGREWEVLPTEFLEGNRLKVQVTVATGSLYLARLEPYTLSHLEKLKERMARCDDAEIEDIGHTVGGRPLEIIRVGDPQAARRVVIRARAHPWEPGGNWVVDGLLDRLCQDDADARRWRKLFSVCVMPMANKDGVAAGMTRFNLRGEDLNRKWDKPSDPELAPEKHALEQWLEAMIRADRKPDLFIDFHNDQSGRLHIGRPPVANLETYLQRMKDLEAALREHTWFTEGSTTAAFRNPGSIGEGLLQRYGIFAVVHELNADTIAGLDQPAGSKHWKAYGTSLPKALAAYFGETAAE